MPLKPQTIWSYCYIFFRFFLSLSEEEKNSKFEISFTRSARAANSLKMNAYETKVLQKLRNDLEREGFHLAPGWRVAIETRKSGATKGGTDKYYFSPDGRKLRSKTEVMRFLSSTTSDEKSKRGGRGRATKVAKMIEKENIAGEYNEKMQE